MLLSLAFPTRCNGSLGLVIPVLILRQCGTYEALEGLPHLYHGCQRALQQDIGILMSIHRSDGVILRRAGHVGNGKILSFCAGSKMISVWKGLFCEWFHRHLHELGLITNQGEVGYNRRKDIRRQNG